MTEVAIDERDRLPLPEDVRERYGDRYRIVRLHDGIELIPIADDPYELLEALGDEFADVEKSSDELLEEAREAALDEAER